MSVGGAIAGGARLAVASRLRPGRPSGTRSAATARRSSPTPGRCSRDRRGAAEPRRAPPPGPPVHGLGDAARALAPGRASASRPRACSSSTPRPRATRCSSTSTGEKAGARAGRCPAAPRCGSPPTTPSAGRLVEGADGFAIACAKHEAGMLLRERPPRRDRLPATASCAASSSPATPGSRPATSSAATSTATSGSSTTCRR